MIDRGNTFIALVLAGWAAAAGCSTSKPARQYELNGVVRAVDGPKHQITSVHGDVNVVRCQCKKHPFEYSSRA